jgi:hypothetical protein
MRCLFLFIGGGQGQPWGRREADCRRRLERSGSVKEEEEEGRWVPWQAPSLRENIFPENTPRVQAGQAGQRREAAAQEGVGRCSEEGRGRPAGPGGVGLGRPSGQGLGRGKGSGLVGVEGVAGQGWAESGAGPEFKMKFFSNFN